jgi:uncharacterized protein (TIGR03083 family)
MHGFSSASSASVAVMTLLAYPSYLDHIRRESVRFREVLTDTEPATPVVSCPGWTAADLLFHLGGVQHWWSQVVTQRPADPTEGYAEPERPATYDRLLAFFDESSDRLAGALAGADPADECWSWSADHSIGFVLRRQAHEALIHRLDAELAAGTPTALDPALAADGVHECLDLMYGGMPPWGSFAPLPHHVEFAITDLDTSVWVQLGVFSGTSPDGVERAGDPDLHVVPAPGVEADAVISGTAADLDAWLWHRGDDSGIHVTGDKDVYARARLVLEQPIT